MKRKSLLFLLLFALLAPWAAQAQVELTVYEGTATNNVIPAYIFYFDDFTRSQYVIPADDLVEMYGGTINSVKFYTTSSNIPYTTVSTVDVYLMEVDYTTMTALEPKANGTIVYQGTLDVVAEGEGGSLTIEFSTPYNYNGGNLLVGIENTTDAGYKGIYFYGQSVTGAAWGGSSSTSLEAVTGSVKDFIPKTTFTYTASATGCDLPTAIAVSDITTDGATVTWEGEGSAWNLRYKTATDADYTMVENLTTTSYTLTGLNGNTTYSVGVQTVCTGSTSPFKSTSFTTANACAAPTGFVASNITASSATISWTAGYQETAWTVKYKKSSDSSWDNATTVSVSGTPTTSLTGLDGLTTYNVRVYNCTGESDPYLSGNFTTAASFPYIQDFTNSGIPTGWSTYSGLLDDVMAGTATLESGTAWYNGTSNGVLNGNHLYSNIYGTSRKHWIVTPSIPMESGARLTFDVAYTAYSGTAANPATTGTDDKFVVLISTDNMATWTILRQWDNAGSEYVLNELTPATTNLVFDMADYAGQNVIVAFYAESTVSNADNNIHVDNVAFELVPACEKPTELAVVDNSVTAHSAQLSWVSDATAWIVAYKTATDTDFTEVNVSENPYTLTGLTENTTYTAKVCAVCDGTPSEWSISTVSFTTPIACPAPTGLTVSGTTGNQTTLNWTGTSDSYDVLYRTALYADGINENFGTSIPTGWSMYTGLLSDVMASTAELTAATYGWSFGTGNGVFDNHARINIYGTSCNKWLVMPAVTLENNAQLSFDLALTKYSGNLQPVDPAEQTDDKFVVLIKVGETWTILRQWDNAGSEYVYNNIACSAVGENVTIDLSSYAGQNIAIAFYGESTVSGGDNNLHIDNVYCGILHAAGEWMTAAEGVTETTYTLTGLSPETDYEAKVLSNCEGETGHETMVSFTTEAACMVPNNLAVNYTGGTTATVSWASDATSWNIDVNGTVTAITENPYTLTGLEMATTYTVKVQTNCGDATSDWSNAVSFTTDLCAAEDMCEITFELTDSWGDGWNGNAIQVVDVLTEAVLGTFTNTNDAGAGEAQTYTLAVCDGRDIQFVWVSGSYPGETSYVVYDLNGEVIFSGSDAMSEPVNYTVSCTVNLCVTPKDLAVNNVTPDAATVSWTSDHDNFQMWYRPNTSPNNDFETSSMKKWTTIDADGDGYDWVLGSQAGGIYLAEGGSLAGAGHDSSNDLITSGSYSNATGAALTPDNYLVSPLVELGGRITFYACAQDANYCEEHFGVFVSTTSNTDPSAFTMIQEWTITSDGKGAGARAKLGTTRSDNRSQSTWQEYSVNLSDYSGYGYVAIRHFNCTDMFMLNVDDIVISQPNYTEPEWIVVNDIEASPYTLENLESGTEYEVMLRGVCGEDSYTAWAATTFETPNACDAPTDLAAEIEGTNATLTWNASLDSYNVRYRTAEYQTAYFEDVFDDTQGASWTQIDGYTNYVWSGTSDAFVLMGYDGSGEIGYAITPELSGEYEEGSFVYFEYRTIPADSLRTFKVGYSSTTADVDAFSWGEDVTTTANYWDYFYELIPAGTKYVAIQHTDDYASVGFVFDNFGVYAPAVEAGEWVVVENATSPMNITGLNPETYYEWQVQGVNCDGNGNTTNWSASDYFLTGEQTNSTLTVDLNAGANWFSTSVDITLDDLKSALLTALNNANGIKITTQSNGYTNWNGNAWKGKISLFEIGQYFLIEVPSDCEITLEGEPINPTEHPLTIAPGANWIGFPFNESMTVADAFAGFPTRTDRITSQANGYTSYNGNTWKGGLTTLEPGQGYIYNSASTETKTFTYPTGTSKAAQTSVKPGIRPVAKKQMIKTDSFNAK